MTRIIADLSGVLGVAATITLLGMAMVRACRMRAGRRTVSLDYLNERET